MAWPRIRNLPLNEQAVFWHWIAPQTRPLLEGVPDDEQDAYYQHDYERWKEQGMPLAQAYAGWD